MNKSNLIKLREHLKTIDPFTFYMGEFSRSDGENHVTTAEEANEINWCGTAACMVGHASTIFPFEEGDVSTHMGIRWITYSERLFGIDGSSPEWRFLFESYWGDSIPDAIRRLDYVIEHGHAPQGGDEILRQYGARHDY